MFITMEITVVLMVALLAAFIVLLSAKFKVTERVQIHGNDFFAEMFSCEFCLSFWVAVVISVIAYLFVWDWRLILVPILSTPLTRKLL